VSDLAKWNVHGPVKTLKSGFATWDLERQDWQSVHHFAVASFHPNGAISSTDHHNRDGTISHSLWIYDDAGRMVESNCWMNDERIDRVVYVYDEAERHIRTTRLNHDGAGVDSEVCNYDADGRKAKVRFLHRHEANAECMAGNACEANTFYAIEGTDSAYGAPGATTMTINYDEKNLPAKVSFHDANHQSLSYVILKRDSSGRLLSEEFHQGERSPLQGFLEKAPSEQRERLAAMLKDALGETLSSKTYTYDAKGRIVTRENRMSSLGGDSTTYSYGERDDPIEETTEHRSCEGNVDETGNVHYSSDRVNLQHNRLEYLYDEYGNWTERIVSFRLESKPGFQRSNIERRTFTYYST
jgi:hypothetical protein